MMELQLTPIIELNFWNEIVLQISRRQLYEPDFFNCIYLLSSNWGFYTKIEISSEQNILIRKYQIIIIHYY